MHHLASRSPPPIIAPAVDRTFSFRLLNDEDVLKKLMSLNVWKSAGLDRISNRVLKECAEIFTSPLTHIFNLSLKSGTFPSQWKKGLVCPVYKNKGSRSDVKCYRPITLLPCASKVFESFVRDQLQMHCLENAAIPDDQFGFLPKRSTVWQLLSTIDDWEETLDNGYRVHACFLDMAKAFDKVNHDLLLHKLRSVGVYSLELKWFSSYLHGRSISTVVEGVKSSRSCISSGVPQGSVLGPLLFLVYYRDLPSVTSSSTAMFADDTQLYDRCLNSPNQCNGAFANYVNRTNCS